MKLTVERGNLFSVEGEGYYFAHCISADFALEQGIAKQFRKRYDMKNKLINEVGPFSRKQPNCILIDNVFNLVTKKFKYNKPTYETLEAALRMMKEQCLEKQIMKIAMPKIGCNLDKLNWKSVENKIHKVFRSTDIEIRIIDLEV
jgi:hypothetical protein